MNIFEKIKEFLFRNNKTQLIEEKKEEIEKTYEDELYEQYGRCRDIKKYNLKILFITDTHNCLTYDKECIEYIKNAKDYDYCILLGDHSAEDLYEITQIIPKDKICGVLGNHDSWDKYKENGINNIDGKTIEIKGTKIAGISGSFKYKNTDQYALYTHEESIEIADKMEKADILVSHDKPFTKDLHDNAHDGLKGITKYLYKNQVPLHIHGHLHEESEEYLKNGTKTICLFKAKIVEI